MELRDYEGDMNSVSNRKAGGESETLTEGQILREAVWLISQNNYLPREAKRSFARQMKKRAVFSGASVDVFDASGVLLKTAKGTGISRSSVYRCLRRVHEVCVPDEEQGRILEGVKRLIADNGYLTPKAKNRFVRQMEQGPRYLTPHRKLLAAARNAGISNTVIYHCLEKVKKADGGKNEQVQVVVFDETQMKIRELVKQTIKNKARLATQVKQEFIRQIELGAKIFTAAKKAGIPKSSVQNYLRKAKELAAAGPEADSKRRIQIATQERIREEAKRLIVANKRLASRVQQEFVRKIEQGSTAREAARVAGVSHGCINRSLLKARGLVAAAAAR